ncbi:MAG: sensor histidine kinase [Gammaproteobacteria bacterium]|nr:MAG: sensor histidine kinase [Gammaproteobacteria bacterium]
MQKVKMIWPSLYTRLAVWLTCILMLVGLLYVTLISHIQKQDARTVDQQLNRNLAASLVAERNLIEENRLNEAALKRAFMYFMNINPSIEIYLLDVEGRILSYSADPGKVKRKRVSLGPIRTFLKGGEFPILGDDPRDPSAQKVFSVTPIPNASQPEGYLYVILRGEQFDSVEMMARDKQRLSLGLWVVAISLGAGLLVGLAGMYLITRRLTRLSRSVRSFRANDFSYSVPLVVEQNRRDEIGQLSEAFEEMSKRIQDQLQQLQAQDEKRRELIANVSHDLRTPLAAMHSYLETLSIKEKDLTPAERLEYLQQALKNSHRLLQLVEELFELARLDNLDQLPDMEPFSIRELAHDVVQQYQHLAERKHIHLQIVTQGDDMLVRGHIGLLQRVLENLIANAIRYTDRGEVTIRLSSHADRVEVSVEDTGRGIEEAAIPHIFDRFYRADNAHRGEGRHSGLGLAIVKRILDLHDVPIHVSSRIDAGSTFRFFLGCAVQ